MKGVAVAVYIIGGIISIEMTLKYLPSGILFMLCLPLFPFFGLYAGAEYGDWGPSKWLFISWGVSTVLIAIGDKVNGEN